MWIARMPCQYKQGDEVHNTNLYNARIRIGKIWMSHFPRTFLDDIIAALFLDIDKERAAKILRTYHDEHMRMNSNESASLNAFVGMNDSQYVRLMRSLSYFSGMKRMCPINEIYLLREKKIKQDYTLKRTVVDMT